VSVLDVSIRRLPHAADLPLPAYQTEAAAGLDLLAAIEAPLAIAPGATALLPTGIAVELPAGIEGQVRPRSGLAAQHGVTVLNAPGTIDPDYRGEIKVILINLGQNDFVVQRGMRIAQLVLARFCRVRLVLADRLEETERGAKGFGSTGEKTANT
jgi:dUTP pyrophosphatase